MSTVNEEFSVLLQRAESVLARLEQRLPPACGEPDWSAHAFRWRNPGWLAPVHHPHDVRLRDLLGIEEQKNELERNTRQFLGGRPANNALLWGSRGTGKSTLIKALLNRYAPDGLRLVEVDKAALVDLPDIVEPLRARPERFILFSDDLSFESDDASYKALKGILDGSVTAPPANVLIYATSNRRHLMPEYQRENQDTRVVNGEIHHGEAVEEKISLSERFGLWLAFHPFNQAEYLDIVARHLANYGVELDEPAREAALRWALTRGSRSGRAALQFARDWAGQQ
jgi:predicted AAA+ superfamily ATPase